MAISDKLNYLIETKSQLKDMINYGLDENKITSSTTFRNYVSSIKEAFLEALRTPDTLFTNLPKKSASGSNISLTGVANAPMRITLSPSELTQASTPTPSSPQEVHTISGSNTLKVIGKNLFDKDYYLAQKDNFTHPEGNSYFYFLKLDDKFKSVFTASVILTGTSQTNLVLAFDTQNVASPSSEKRVLNIGGALNNITYDFTNASDVYLVIGSNDFNISIENRLNAMFNNYNIQLEKGSTATSYEPYVSQTAEVNLGVENLYNATTNAIVSSSTTRLQTNGYIFLKAGTYTLGYEGVNQVYAIYYDSTYTKVGETNWTTGDLTFTFNQDYYYKFTFRKTGDATVSPTDISNIVLVKGDKVQQVSENPIEYSKINTYKDQFIRTSGKNLMPLTNQNFTINNVSFKVQNGSIVLNGTANANITGFIMHTDNYFPITLDAGTYYFKRNLTNRSVGLIKANETVVVSLSGTSPATSTTFTLSEKTTLYLFFYIASGTAITNEAWNIMISKEDTDYEPYGSNEWYIKKNIGKVVLDGNSNIEETISFGSYYRAKFSISDILIPTANSIQLYSNYFYGDTNALNSSNANVGMMAQFRNDNKVYFITEETSSANFKTWLSTHNTTVYYVMQTPTYTKITGTLETQLENVYQKLLSYSGTTNISQINNDLSFNMVVSAIEK